MTPSEKRIFAIENARFDIDGRDVYLPPFLVLQAGELLRLLTFLHESGGTSQVLGDGQHPSTLEGVLRRAMQDRDGASLKARIVRDIRRIHTTETFSSHLAGLKAIGSPLCGSIPRLRDLLLSDTLEMRQQEVIETFLSNVRSDDPASADVETLYDLFFESDAFADCGQPESKSGLVARLKRWPAELARLGLRLERGPITHPDLHDHFLRFIEHLNASRHFERVVRNCHHLLRQGVRQSIATRAYDLLWFAQYRLGAHEDACRSLESLLVIDPLSQRALVDRALAVEAVAPDRFLPHLEIAGADIGQSAAPGHILYAERCVDIGELERAEQAIRMALVRDGAGRINASYLLALQNIYFARSGSFDYFGSYLEQCGVRDRPHSGDLLKMARPNADYVESRGLVSIIMTAFNSAMFIEDAVRSICAQTYRDLELIIVDDCSTDDTVARVTRLMKGDSRLTIVRNDRNIGTYAAKNRGIRQTRGAYVALCDSDDIWLSDHLARHVAAMVERPECVVSTSRWIRIGKDQRIEMGLRGTYVGTCPHSTFFRREVFERIGDCDAVRFGADREFLTRLWLYYGTDACHDIGVVATLGRRHDASLTSSGPGAIHDRMFSPVRLEYWTAWNEWHLAAIRSGSLPFTSGEPDDRPFEVPEVMKPLGAAHAFT